MSKLPAPRPTGRSGRRAGRPPLSRERIVKAAMAIVDREGLKELSMRRLGHRLGVDPMAVYYHVPNKEALLDAIVEAVMGEIDLSRDDRSRSTEERVLVAARAYRDAMLAHRNALPIILSRGPRTPVALRPVELLVGIFREAGLPLWEALAAMNVVAAAVRGATAVQDEEMSPEAVAAIAESMMGTLSPEEFPNLREVVRCCTPDADAEFEFGIRAMVRGLLIPSRPLGARANTGAAGASAAATSYPPNRSETMRGARDRHKQRP